MRSRSIVADTATAVADLRTVDDLLVQPRLYTLPRKEASATRAGLAVAQPTTDPLSAILAGKVLIVCSDDAQGGVTSALLWLLAKQFDRSDSYLPAYINEPQRLGTRDEARVIRTALAQVGFASDGGEHPNLLLAVDDVDSTNPARLDRLAAFIANHPEHGFVLGCHGDQHAGIADALTVRELSYERTHVWPFATRELRELVSRILGVEDNDLVKQVSAFIRRHRLPRTPFVVAALIAVIRERQETEVTNESGILWAYANLLLGAGEGGERDDLGQDYRNREFLLGYLAAELVTSGAATMARAGAEAFFVEYFAGRSFTRSPVAVLDDLIQRRLLIEEHDRVGFRHIALLYLFAGNHLNDPGQDGFRRRVLTDTLRFGSVVRHAAGLSRSDVGLLREVTAIARSVTDAGVDIVIPGLFSKALRGEGLPPADLETLPLHQNGQIGHDASHETEDAVADTLDGMAPADEEFGPEELDDTQRLLAAFEVLTAVLSTAELVNDTDAKADALGEVLRAAVLIGDFLFSAETQASAVTQVFLDGIAEARAHGAAIPFSEDDIRNSINRIITFVVVGMSVAPARPHVAAAIRQLLEGEEAWETPDLALLLTLLAVGAQLDHLEENLSRLYGAFPDYAFLREIVGTVALSVYESVNDDAAALRLMPLLLAHHAPGADPRTSLLSQTRNKLEQRRIRRRYAMAQGEVDVLDQTDIELSSDTESQLG